MNKEEKLNKEILALFLFLLNYSNRKDFKELLKSYRQYRDTYKDRINRIIAKYSHDGEFKISNNHFRKEMKQLQPFFKEMGKDLYKQEKGFLLYILPLIFTQSYNKTYNILNKGSNENLSNISKGYIDRVVIGWKYNDRGKTILQRNKQNKEVLINKLNTQVKSSLKKNKPIDIINKEIDKIFGYGAYMSQRILESETDRLFNTGVVKAYKDSGIKRIRYNSVLEKNTCGVCASLDGVIFNIGEEPSLPLHTNCNCWYEVVLD